jgi:hypothetical protein
MGAQIRSLGVTVMFFLGWVVTTGFTIRHWHAESSLLRISTVALVISYPTPWVRCVRDGFSTWQMALFSYVALGSALWVIIMLRYSFSYSFKYDPFGRRGL